MCGVGLGGCPIPSANADLHLQDEVHRCLLTLYYAILYHTILYYTIPYCTLLYYTILYCTILYSFILCSSILYYTILYYTILYYTILYYSYNYNNNYISLDAAVLFSCNHNSYEEFARLAETRLAQNSSNYINIS